MIAGRLLIVGGDITSRFILKAHLDAANHRVQTVCNVTEALHAGMDISAIILTNKTPSSLQHDIATLKYNLSAPVIVICDKKQRQAAFKAGADHVVEHGCHHHVFRARLRSWLAKPVKADHRFVEYQNNFIPPDRFALVTDDVLIASEWRLAITAVTGCQPQVMSYKAALRSPPPDLTTILIDGGPEDIKVQYLADLRARLARDERRVALGLIQRDPIAEEEARALEIGAVDVLPGNLSKIHGTPELEARLGFLLSRGQEEARRQYDAYLARWLAEIDPLTGLANRRKITSEITTAVSTGNNFSILMVDIDRFKSINDTYGHKTGDAAICQIGEILSECIGARGCIARYGGEEFLALLPQTDEIEAVSLAEQIRHRIAGQLIVTEGRQGSVEFHISVSVGVSTYDNLDYIADNNISEEMVRRADIALLAAKEAGRNLVMLAPAA